MYFRFEAAMFDQPASLTSNNIHNSPNVLLDPENVGVAAGISKLSYTTVHMYFRLLDAIFDFLVALTSDNIHYCPTALLDPDNVRVAVGIS